MSGAGRILCVEDNEDMLMLLKDRLEWEGFGVGEATTIGAARGLLGAEEFDLVLLDLMLPDGNGLDLLDDIRSEARNKDLPVLILSGRGDDETMRDGIRRGAQGYLVKKVGFDELVAAIRKQIGQGG